MKLPDFFGLDIGYSTLKVAQISGMNSGKYVLATLGQGDLDKPITLLKEVAEKKALSERIKLVIDSANIKTKKVVVSLPESAIFTKIIAVPDLPEDQLEKVIFFEARNHLPVAPEDVQLDYLPVAHKTLDGNKKILQILLIAAPKTLVNTYLETLSACGLEVLALETESIASSRAITNGADYKNGIMVVDFGSMGITVSVIKGKELVFSQSIGTGSPPLSQAIAHDYNLDIRQAEQYKRTYGLLENQLEGRIAKSIMPLMQIINNELNKNINFIKINLPDFTPAELYLTGEGALLPGLVTFMNLNLGLPVKLIDPVANMVLSDLAKAEVQKYASVGYTVAVGLALKTE